MHGGDGDVYRYDELMRLEEIVKGSTDPLGELVQPGTTTHEVTRSYTLDADSHREAVVTTPDGGSSQAESYATDPRRNHYTNVGGVPRTTDAAGNLKSIGLRRLEYDAWDNLTEIVDGGQVVATYTYDAVGRRRTKTVDDVTTRFLHAGPWLIEEYTTELGQTEVLEATHFYGDGVDEVVLTKRVDRTDLDGDQDTTELIELYYHRNQLGSVMHLTLANGSVAESYSYDAYGAPRFFDGTGQSIAQSNAGR
ncbi:MAG: RHS repeat protein [bacterium]|nr:RHS repeat protein [bacterium]